MLEEGQPMRPFVRAILVGLACLSTTALSLSACAGDDQGAAGRTSTQEAAAADSGTSAPAAAITSATTLPTAAPTPTPVYAITPLMLGQALQRIQDYLDSWQKDGLLVASQMLVPTQRPALDEGPRLLSGRVIDYSIDDGSADEFVLLVTLDLHFPGGDGWAWGEGHNTRFITFSYADPPAALLMSFATSPSARSSPRTIPRGGQIPVATTAGP
jgi:hypothetical protein